MHHSRWARSTVTFGPVGRVVATVAVLLPIWWWLAWALFAAVLGLPVYLFVLLPWAMRDIWRRVPTRPLDPLGVGVVAGLEPPAVEPETSIERRTPPPRW